MTQNNIDFYTIGVYGSTESDFFDKIVNHQIDCFCDIRKRRGVRGKEYSFVNSKRLQAKLASMSVFYKHILDLAPSDEIREKQKEEDAKNMVTKRDRDELGQIFTSLYLEHVLNSFSLNELISHFKSLEFKKVVLFCVEAKPNACHRSLVAKEISKLGYNVIDL
jgi:uncharacterized protein (DUF488 family)